MSLYILGLCLLNPYYNNEVLYLSIYYSSLLYAVKCPTPVNGRLECECPGTNGFYQDNCTFFCNPGYELQGPSNGTCLADQSWSGGLPFCVPLNCSTSPPVDNSQLQLPCDTQYQSTCTATCNEGYTRDVTNITYLCNVTLNPNVVEWRVVDGASCLRGITRYYCIL